MQFNVAHLLKGPVGTSERHKLDATFAPFELSHTDHAWGTVRLTRVDKGVWVNGSLEASAVCTCSRCLKEFAFSLRFELDEIYQPLANLATGAPLPVSEDIEPGFTIDEHHHVLDITEAVRQSVIVALPMKPLCRQGCAGICPDCGVNRNEARCICQSAKVNPRRQALMRLSR